MNYHLTKVVSIKPMTNGQVISILVLRFYIKKILKTKQQQKQTNPQPIIYNKTKQMLEVGNF